MLIHKNTRTLLQRLSLSCLEIRSSNEKAINSTRNRIYSLKVFHFLLYRHRVFFRMFTFYLFLNWLSTRVSDDQKYVCGRRLYARKIQKNLRASIPEKLHHCHRSKKWFTWHVISIIVENKPRAHHKTICIQWKFTSPDHRSFVFSTTQ